ncbi:MAG: hypothetical protein JNM68_00090 [Dinghuibacter sp.]|nr:hypothetical protein [Dinghuibacter sp.]
MCTLQHLEQVANTSGLQNASCPVCGGSGAFRCSSCGGTGKMDPADPYSLSCSFCGGDGQNNCTNCGGSGQV